ncbi:MAG: ABC transporter ATP-binding protein [Chloroflexi bacterium]|nr:ABC transporter ATP-binding protein [Chloroflexota bacterium]
MRTGYGAQFQLRHVSFGLRGGDVAGVIGPNGGGKSTLLKALAGVIAIGEGAITLDGAPIRRSQADIAFVPQREEVNWDFPVTARDVVLMGRYRSAGWVRWPGREDRKKADAALEQLGLGGLGGRHISQFSGGQQQRVFLARAIAQEPRVIVLDEPLAGVDATNREIFHRAIESFARAGLIVVMATHDLDEVEATCSHLCCLNQRVVAFGPVKDVFTPDILKATFGGQMAVFR